MKEIVPEQNTGTPIDTESIVELSTQDEAKKVFEVVKEKLQNVNEWHTVAGALSANFQLVDQSGEEVKRPAEKGDYFKISIKKTDDFSCTCFCGFNKSILKHEQR